MERQRLPWYQWMEFSFPCDLEPCASLPSSGSFMSKNTKKLFVNVKFDASDVSVFSFHPRFLFVVF